ncbi:hypothetical protein B0H13DRAFT_1874152 [Mycena leptocephala]|nr:hypothetical protein B0H13DRAFT_1874152 [Mycena leptocephala]
MVIAVADADTSMSLERYEHCPACNVDPQQRRSAFRVYDQHQQRKGSTSSIVYETPRPMRGLPILRINIIRKASLMNGRAARHAFSVLTETPRPNSASAPPRRIDLLSRALWEQRAFDSLHQMCTGTVPNKDGTHLSLSSPSSPSRAPCYLYLWMDDSAWYEKGMARLAPRQVQEYSEDSEPSERSEEEKNGVGGEGEGEKGRGEGRGGDGGREIKSEKKGEQGQEGRRCTLLVLPVEQKIHLTEGKILSRASARTHDHGMNRASLPVNERADKCQPPIREDKPRLSRRRKASVKASGWAGQIKIKMTGGKSKHKTPGPERSQACSSTPNWRTCASSLPHQPPPIFKHSKQEPSRRMQEAGSKFERDAPSFGAL